VNAFEAILIPPIFFSLLIGLTRKKGDRLIAGIGVYLIYIVLATVLFGSLSLANRLILSALYGPKGAFTGAVTIVRGRTYIELSNGARYEGIWSVLWNIADFVTLAVIGTTVYRIFRWIYMHSNLFRRLTSRFEKAFSGKVT
jgi:hypothetical protein